MFDVTEYRILQAEPKTLEAAVPAAGHQAALAQMVPVLPGVWQGKSMQAHWGLFVNVMVRASPAQNGTALELRVGAELEQTNMIVFIVICLFFWPAGLIIGWLAYDDFTKRRTYILHGMWQQLGGGVVPAPGPYGVNMPPPGGFSGNFG